MKKIYSLFNLLIYCILSGHLYAQQFNVVGSGVQNSCLCYQLTGASQSIGGAIWNNNAISLANSFDFNFSVFLGNYDPSYQDPSGFCGPGADGICFVLQNSNTGVFNAGGGLGYEGFPNQSLGIELDTYQNGWDPPYSHIAIEYNGQVEHPTGTLAGPVQMSSTEYYTMDSNWHNFEVKWDVPSQTISTYFDGAFRVSYTFPGGIISDIFAGNGSNIYWGFTGSTGAFCNVQQVCLNLASNFVDTVSQGHCSDSVNFYNASTSGLNNILSYSWQFGDGDSANSQNPSHVYQAPGSYNVTLDITDQSLCTSDTSIPVTIPTVLVLNISGFNDSCFSTSSGSAVVQITSGNPPYQYAWSNGTTDSSVYNLPAGNYSVTVNDNSQCQAVDSIVINQPDTLSVSVNVQDEACFGGATGSILVNANGGTAPYNYTWIPVTVAGNKPTGLAAGSYYLTITDAKGCKLPDSISIVEPSAISLTTTRGNILCNGDSTGSITAMASGGTPAYNFSCNSSASSMNVSSWTFNSLAAGTYILLAVDSNGCLDSLPVTINQSAMLQDSLVENGNPCSSSDGQIVVSVNGGSGPYTFNFSNGIHNTTGTLNNLQAGDYTVTVTDSNGCTADANGQIPESDTIMVTVEPAVANVILGQTLQLNTTTNQSGYVYYKWESGKGLSCNDCADPLFEGIYSGVYQLTVTDLNGCEAVAQVDITVVPDYTLYFPNVFAPNANGVNSIWQVFGNLEAVKYFTVMVFDRIGEKVFESNDINYQWSGEYKGLPAQEGVYSYVATVAWLNDYTEKTFVGSITLLR